VSDVVVNRVRMVLGGEVVSGHLRVSAGLITDLSQGNSSLPGTLDGEGDWLLPGLVELHTDNLERHLMPRPKVFFPVQAALQSHDTEVAGAGITTVLDAIAVGNLHGDALRASDQSALLATLDSLQAAGVLRADHHLHLRCELPAAHVRALFEPFAAHPRLRLISLMDHTPGQRQWTEVVHARTYYTGKKGWSDAEFDEELRLAPQRQAEFSAPHRRWFAAFAAEHHIALATHDDTTVEHVEEAVRLGARMSEFPTTLVAAVRARELGLRTVAGAPNVVRGGSHSGNVAVLELARAGVLDALSSDYVPASLLLAAWRLREAAGWSLPQAVALISRQPALAVGLADRGALEIGLRGDFIRVREVNGLPVVREVFVRGRRVA
jgi:alpha-D-ribose 1-methylphosphonate 5-triphosphate diphosphatase